MALPPHAHQTQDARAQRQKSAKLIGEFMTSCDLVEHHALLIKSAQPF